jgi:hypothetical protein
MGLLMSCNEAGTSVMVGHLRANLQQPAIHALLTMVTAVALLGCGDGRPTRAPVSGQVLIDGRPLEFGYVNFIPNEGRSSGAKLGPEGRFSLTCFEQNDGAIVGSHRVAVNAGEPVGADRIRWHAPKKYVDPASSGLIQEVPGPIEGLVIRLSWDGGKPFVEQSEADTEPLPESLRRK